LFKIYIKGLYPILKQKIKRRNTWNSFIVLFLITFSILFCSINWTPYKHISESVLQHQLTVEKYAKKYEIERYIPYLLSIIEVESGGKGMDVMQSSESLGLPRNSLTTDESIEQGCRYFSELVIVAERLDCDFSSVLQSYNFGIGYLYFVAENGKKNSLELAELFSKNYSNNEMVRYNNAIAIEYNGGWRYNYGNMFYASLIQKNVSILEKETNVWRKHKDDKQKTYKQK